ncbi:GNAT family N-acetyltransferase [Roseivirga sp.]|uniref:GNAT family N-acetyltransferase n=1 Tax=Roseivirga sp. TaxID=1964215 RepID=UPI003B51877F
MKNQSIQTSISIRPGNSTDISAVLDIASTWLSAFDPEGKNVNGFLFGTAYTEEDLLRIIESEDIAVALYQEKEVVGYFLVDNFSNNPTSRLYRQHLKALLPGKERVCPRAQIAIKEAYQGMGISGRLTAFLKESVNSRYDAIFSIVSLQNPKMPVHEKAGWQVLGKNDDFYFVMLALK